MVNRRRVLLLGGLLALAFSTALPAQQQQQPQQPPPRKFSDAERRELEAIIKVMAGVEAGQPAPNDLSLSWTREDLLKAQGNRQYVPFIVSYDASKVSAKNLTVYWRVVSSTAPPTPPPDEKDKNRRNEKNAPPEFPYESMNTAAVNPAEGASARLSRSFTVPPGNYHVYVLVKEPASKERNAPPPKLSVIKQTVDVPDLWNGELAISSVFIGRIDPLPAPLTPQQAVDRPYALGGMEIVPSLDMKFTKKNELSALLMIYNAKTDAANMPDVTVEYNFYTKQTGAEKFFNKTNPQYLNAQTLPPQAVADLDSWIPGAGRTDGSARLVPRGRLPPRDQGDGQDREQDADQGCRLLGGRLIPLSDESSRFTSLVVRRSARAPGGTP